MGDEALVKRIPNDFQNAIPQFAIHKFIFSLPPIESGQATRLILSPARLSIARERWAAGRDASFGRTPAAATALTSVREPAPVAR